MNSKCVFVTVGSTSFDKLVSTVCSPKIQEIFISKGYDKVILQIGKGSYIPEKDSKLSLDWFAYKDSITADIEQSSLVISHAGAGSILETLDQQKPLVVVINEELMDNHQEELATQLEERDYLKCCTCSTLAETLENFSVKKIRPYPPSEPLKFPNYLDQVLGYK